MILLDDADLMDAIATRGSRDKLIVAKDVFSRLDSDDRLGRLRHNRNKEVAHLSDLDPTVPRPLIGELITFAHETGGVAAVLAQDTGIVELELETQIKPICGERQGILAAVVNLDQQAQRGREARSQDRGRRNAFAPLMLADLGPAITARVVEAALEVLREMRTAGDEPTRQ